MKKILLRTSRFFAFLVLGGLLAGLPEGWAGTADAIAISLPEGEFLPEAAPLFYSLDEGRWLAGRSGQIFTTGHPAAGFDMPVLKGEPTAIRYPKSASIKGLSGLFVVAVEILEDGRVGRWQVTHSTGYAGLDDASIEAIRTWQFEPAREGGRPMVSCIQIPVRFVLSN